MKKKAAITRADRLERIASARTPRAVDSETVSLLRRALETAGFLRYHDFRGVPDGYFRELLPELEELLAGLACGCLPEPDGRMEPAQALLYAFIRNLSGVAERFNRRWEELPRWYLEEIGGVRDLPQLPHTVWASLEKATAEPVEVQAGHAFGLEVFKGAPSLIFHSTDNVVLENPEVRKILSIYTDRQKKIYPASALDAVTSIEVRDLLHDPEEDQRLFRPKRNLRYSRSPGFIVSSPALLLREGRRSVCLRLETESHALADFIETAKARPDSPFAGWSDAEIVRRLLENVFYVEVSTETGWIAVERVVVVPGDDHPDSLVVRFTLPEDFPSTAACTTEPHGIESRFPAVKVYLNLDAWLYPYSWIRHFILKRIVLDVAVEGVTSLVVYNDLGRVDNAKPFGPFGLGTERGAWFVLGNYEMAVKHTGRFDLHIRWAQLPEECSGLYEYYRAYGEGIDNRSFRVTASYLEDYRWHPDPQQTLHFLFSSDPPAPDGTPLKEAPLAAESRIRGLTAEKMPVTELPEAEYDYTIRAKDGFVRLSLSEPGMGFGQKRYRTLFAEQALRKIRKKSDEPPLQPPISPQIERITADYHASDRIDLRECEPRTDAGFWHIHPLGIRRAYPNRDNRSVSLIGSLDGDAHLVFGLSGVAGGEYLRLWFDFTEMNREMDEYPSVRWFWGDGYRWEELPDDLILRDTTGNLSEAGTIGLDMPDRIDPALFDPEGLLWVRAEVLSGIRHVPRLKRIYPNAIELVLAAGEPFPGAIAEDRVDCMGLKPLKPLPGVQRVCRLSPVAGGRVPETPDEKLARISEYVTHRGRAVTVRDYERLVLQAFPEVELVRCFPALDTKGERPGVVTVVVAPATAPKRHRRGWPEMSGTQILKMENYLRERAGPAVTQVDVINPEYEEILIRGRVVFRAGYSTGSCRARLKALCDSLIAPWLVTKEVPRLGAPICYETIAEALRAEPYLESLGSLSLIRIARRTGRGYILEDHDHPENPIHPSVPYAVFVPAREHLFPTEGEEAFGISEMSIGQHFIIKEPAT